MFQFAERLISEGAAAAYDAHRAARESDLARSYTDIALPRADHARAVRTYEADRWVIMLELAVHASFVLGRDPLGYADDYLHAGSGCLKYRPRCDLGWHRYKAGIGTSRRPRFSRGSKHRNAFSLLAPLGRVDPGDHLRAIVAVAETVETRLPTGQAVDHQSRRFVYEDAHFSLPARRSEE